MKVALICFSLTGQQTGERLYRGLEAAGLTAELDKKSKYLPDSIQISTSAWAGEKFSDSDALIFIGATGIAVRSIAPYVASKKSDPAVLVVDECGKFVISLLSGHLGGANELALKTAEILEAIPVVTTATDLHHRFAVDVFAKKNNCNIFNMKAAKEVSAALLAGKKVGFYSEFPTDGELPEGLIRCDEYGNPVSSMDDRSEEETQKSSDFNGTGTDCTNIDCGVAVTVHTSCNPFISTTQVVPKCLTLGMGCRKDKDARGIAEAAQKVLDRSGFHKEAFEQIASIDLKKEEKGILSLSQDWQIPFVTYTEEELKIIDSLNDAGADATVKEAFGDLVDIKSIKLFEGTEEDKEVNVEELLEKLHFLSPVWELKFDGVEPTKENPVICTFTANNLTEDMDVYMLYMCREDGWELLKAEEPEENKDEESTEEETEESSEEPEENEKKNQVKIAIHSGSAPAALVYGLKDETTEEAEGTSPVVAEETEE